MKYTPRRISRTRDHHSTRGIFHDLTVHVKCTKMYIFATLTKKIASNSINHSIRFQSVTSSHFFHVFTFLFRNIGTLNFVFFSIFGSTFAFRRRMSILKKSCKLYAILIAFFGFCGCLSTPARTFSSPRYFPPFFIENHEQWTIADDRRIKKHIKEIYCSRNLLKKYRKETYCCFEQDWEFFF